MASILLLVARRRKPLDQYDPTLSDATTVETTAWCLDAKKVESKVEPWDDWLVHWMVELLVCQLGLKRVAVTGSETGCKMVHSKEMK